MEKKILLQHPLWGSPREFNYDHAMNILELEKQHPSGITLVDNQDVEDHSSSQETESDAAVNSGHQENTERRVRKSKAHTEGKTSGK